MTLRILTAPVIVALLLLSAGCVGGDGSGDGASAGDTPPPSGSMADGTSDDGLSIVSDLDGRLRAAGSYTATWELRGTEAGEPASVTRNAAMIDFANEQSYVQLGSEAAGQAQGGMEVYHADGVSYRRVGDTDTPVFMATEEAFDPTLQSSIRPMVSNSPDLDGFSVRGRETFDGVPVRRYVMTERAPWIMAQSQVADSEFRVTDFEYELLVDTDGLVRFERWHVEGIQEDAERTVTFEYSLRDVGSTSVAEPDWLDAARAQTGQ